MELYIRCHWSLASWHLCLNMVFILRKSTGDFILCIIAWIRIVTLRTFIFCNKNNNKKQTTPTKHQDTHTKKPLSMFMHIISGYDTPEPLDGRQSSCKVVLLQATCSETEQMKLDTSPHHCYPLVVAVISGVKQRFGFIFHDAWVATVCQTVLIT